MLVLERKISMVGAEIKIDRRVRKTKKAIKSAFMSLVAKNDISKIAIKDICDLADINRKTFYAHYHDIPAVINDIANEISVNLLDNIGNYDFKKHRFNPHIIFKELTKIINGNSDYYNLLMNESASAAIFDKAKIMLKDRFLELFSLEKTQINDFVLYFAFDCISSGLIGIYKEWLKSDRNVSLEDLSEQIGDVIFGGINTIIP